MICWAPMVALLGVVAPNEQGQGGVPGVAYANIRITGPTEYLTEDGDLVPRTQHAVSLGSLTLS
jgi:hypothetical protein